MQSPSKSRPKTQRGAAAVQTVILVVVVAAAGTASLGAFGRSAGHAIAGDASSHGGRSPRGRANGMVTAAQAGTFDGAAHAAAAVRETLPAAGAMYGKATLNWKLAREGTLLFGGQRALLLQVADPRVAAGVAKYSSFRDNPFDRLAKTLDAMMDITFGSPEARADTLARLERIHSHVKGTTADGAKYTAMDPKLQFWIHATLVDTALEVERRINGRFTDVERAAYYDETKALARAFQIPESEIPENYAAFQRYMQRQFETLQPSAESKDLAKYILRPSVWHIPKVAFAPLDWMTRDLMPPALRKAYGIRSPRRGERLAVGALRVGARRVVAPVATAASGFLDPRALLAPLMGERGGSVPTK